MEKPHLISMERTQIAMRENFQVQYFTDFQQVPQRGL